MERIAEEDVDCFLLQMEQRFSEKRKREKCTKEWRQLSGFTLWIPKEFFQTDRDAVADVFWSENRPDILFLTVGKTEGITFQILEREESLWNRNGNPMEQFKHLLGKLDDRTVCYGMGETGENVQVFWLEYKSFAADERVYNLLFLFRTEEKDILGTFYCPFEEYDSWKPMIWEVIQTIREEDEDERV